ncbi:hypothetical protein PENSPDRAFT_680367 [Peniophora sp. CONT]|nr:hypothetical protein PENSPDRAFT_680367 [Peniophora sp. CONT]
MFVKIFTTIIILATAASVSAHTIFTPAIGISGRAAVRADVERTTAAAPCGPNVDVATAIPGSTAATLNADGTFTVTVTDFNGGADGSRAVATAMVDPTGTGASFPDTATVLVNGDPAPATAGSEEVTLELPAGTVCSGGNDGASCLVALATAATFGNCVLVSSA